MQGLITLDFGNSHPHAGLFQKNQNKWDLIKTVPWQELSLYLNQLSMDPNNTSMVLCEVKAREEELFPYLQQGFALTRVKEYWRGKKFAGMPIHYAETLGEDRLIQAYYLFKTDKTPTLLIDAGTYVTMDVINSTGLMGGYIIPSTENYFETFQKGEQLKGIALTAQEASALPQTTADAISHSYDAFLALAKKLVEDYGIKRVMLTGGKSTWWLKGLNAQLSGIAVKEEKDLIHLALNYWMTTQIEPL